MIRKQKSPTSTSNRSNMESHEIDDYDEGTDEFAGFSGETK